MDAAQQPTVAVTGGTGFIGQAVCNALRSAGFAVRSLLRTPSAVAERMATQGVEFVTGDLADSGALDTLLTGTIAVIHCAAFKAKSSLATSELINVVGTQQLLDAALRNKVRRFVYLSSISVYRATHQDDGMFTEGVRPVLDPRLNPYSFTKLKGEHIVEEFCARSGLEFVILRPTNVYGPGSLSWDESTAAALRAWHIKFGRIPFDFVGIDDVAKVIVASVTAPAANETFNIGGEMVEHRSFCAHIASQRGITAGNLWRPIDWTVRWSLRLIERVRGNIRSMDYSRAAHYPHEKAQRLLGYQPRRFGDQ